MTVEEAIREADDLKPNAFTEGTKTRWLSELEGHLAANVLLLAAPELRLFQYRWPEDAGTGLVIEPPHDVLYIQWLLAKIDEANGEYDRFANSMAVYNALYENFVRWFCSVYDPAQGYQSRRAERMSP